jgi:hypothetical protein
MGLADPIYTSRPDMTNTLRWRILSLEHTFSIELSSKTHVRHLIVSDTSPDRVFFEGSLGQLLALKLIEGRTLEIQGVHGVLRVDLLEADIHNMLTTHQES